MTNECDVCKGIAAAPDDATTHEAYVSGFVLGYLVGQSPIRFDDLCVEHANALWTGLELLVTAARAELRAKSK